MNLFLLLLQDALVTAHAAPLKAPEFVDDPDPGDVDIPAGMQRRSCTTCARLVHLDRRATVCCCGVTLVPLAAR